MKKYRAVPFTAPCGRVVWNVVEVDVVGIATAMRAVIYGVDTRAHAVEYARTTNPLRLVA